MSTDVVLRSATLEDLPLLRHWDEQPHVIGSDPNDDWNWESELGRDPDWREQLVAELDAQPIGFIQIIDPAREESHYWGDCPENLRAIDIWIGKNEVCGNEVRWTRSVPCGAVKASSDPVRLMELKRISRVLQRLTHRGGAAVD